MNLSQISTIVGQRCGLIGNNDIAAAQAFLTMRHDQLWRAFLWKDSLCEYVTPVAPASTTPYVPNANYMPTRNDIILPPEIAQVIACRTDHHKMDVQRPMLFYRVDHAGFHRKGCPCEFMLLSSKVWEFDTPQSFCISAQNVNDTTVNINVDYLGSDNVSIVRQSVPISYQYTPVVDTTGAIVNITKPVTQGQVYLGVPSFVFGESLSWAVTSNSSITSPTTAFLLNDAHEGQISVGDIIQVTATGFQMTLMVTFVAGERIGFNKYINIQGTWLQPSGDSAVGTSIPANVNISVITQSVLTIATANPTDVVFEKSQIIKMIGIPQKATNVHVLGKRITPTFSNATDVPGVNGMDAILMALVYYDMMHRDERGGSPEADKAMIEAVGPKFLMEGKPGGFLGKLIEEEVVQAAYNCRIIPEDGFGGGRGGFWYGEKDHPYCY